MVYPSLSPFCVGGISLAPRFEVLSGCTCRFTYLQRYGNRILLLRRRLVPFVVIALLVYRVIHPGRAKIKAIHANGR